MYRTPAPYLCRDLVGRLMKPFLVAGLGAQEGESVLSQMGRQGHSPHLMQKATFAWRRQRKAVCRRHLREGVSPEVLGGGSLTSVLAAMLSLCGVYALLADSSVHWTLVC